MGYIIGSVCSTYKCIAELGNFFWNVDRLSWFMNSSSIYIISQYHTRRFAKPDKCRTLTILWSSCFPFLYKFITHSISSGTITISAKLKSYLFFECKKKKTKELSHRIGSMQIFAVTSCHAEQLSHTPILPWHFVLVYLCELEIFLQKKRYWD